MAGKKVGPPGYRYKREHKGYRPGHEPKLSPMQRASKNLLQIRKMLKGKAEAGDFDWDPELKKAIEGGATPLELLVMFALRQDTPRMGTLAGLMDAMKYTHLMPKDNVAAAAGNQQIVVQIANYSPQVAPAVALPAIEVQAEKYIEANEPAEDEVA